MTEVRVTTCRACGRWMKGDGVYLATVEETEDGLGEPEVIGAFCEVCRRRIRRYALRTLPKEREADRVGHVDVDRDLEWGYKEDDE